MVETHSGKSTTLYTQAQEEQAAAILRERKENETKELIRQAKKLVVQEEQAAKKKKLEEEMERLKEEEKMKEVEEKKIEEEEAKEEPQLKRSAEKRGETSGTKKDASWLETKVSKWVANLSLGEEEEAMLYVPLGKKEAVIGEWEAEKDPLRRQTIEEEKKLEWKLCLTREKKKRMEEANKVARELEVIKAQREEIKAQEGVQGKLDPGKERRLQREARERGILLRARAAAVDAERALAAATAAKARATARAEELGKLEDAEATRAAMITGDKAAVYTVYQTNYLGQIKACENHCTTNGGTVATEDDHSRSSPDGGAVPAQGMTPPDAIGSATHGQGDNEDLVDQMFQLDGGGTDPGPASRSAKVPPSPVPTDGPVDVRRQGPGLGKGTMKQGSSTAKEGQKQGPCSARKSSKQGPSGRRSVGGDSTPVTGLEWHQAYPLADESSRHGGSSCVKEVGKRSMTPDHELLKQSIVVCDPTKARAVSTQVLLAGRERLSSVASEIGGEDRDEDWEDGGEGEDGESAVQFCKTIDGGKFVWSRERVLTLFRTMREHSVLATKKSGGVTSAKKWDYVREVTKFPLTATQLENKYRNLRKPYVKYCEVDEEVRKKIKTPPFFDIMAEFLGPLPRNNPGRGGVDSSVAGSDNEEEDTQVE
ncbi:hypothetical protein CBR_g39484 [Chara braunii]|uniref:Myb/SANT-like domain-containing protein n=1 Tax=Chara braunii TaxID=69332 RepID=A0A388LRQ7_CHABU|nr:hypothetical protein CBR_g39484 [Chara braunii]|eukprot:GBG85020.1 hypothetical protein CBR_g39484 [Chara braunii]